MLNLSAPVLLESRGILDKLLALDRLRELYDRARRGPEDSIFDGLLRELRVSHSVEGVVLMAVLARVRPDVKVLANHLLAGLPELADRLIPVDPFAPKRHAQANSRGLRDAVRWLNGGGMLVTFPAGEVSHWDFREGMAADATWPVDIARLARITSASIVPVYFKGLNSIPFYVLGMVHPMLRTARLPEELLNKSGKRVEVRIGSPISRGRVAEAERDEDVIDYVRWRTYLLARRQEAHPPAPDERRAMPPAIQSAKRDLAAEVFRLPAGNCLHETSEYSVPIADADQIPGVLEEIDRFDAHYQHLFLWSKVRQEVAGAYRAVTRPGFSPPWARKGYTRALYSTTTRDSSGRSDRRWSSAGPLCGRNIRSSFCLCCFCGRA